MQSPHELELHLADRTLRRRRQTPLAAHLSDHARVDAIAHEREVACVEIHPFESREHEDADPFVREHSLGIVDVELDDALAQRARAVVEDLLPVRIPPVEIDFLIDAIDQRLFARKIPIEERLRDAEALRKLAGLPVEAELAKETDGFARDQPLALVGGE